VKLDDSGSIVGQRVFGGCGFDYLTDAYEAPGGGYAAQGLTESFRGGGWDIWVLKLDDTGWIADCCLAGDTDAAPTDVTSPHQDFTMEVSWFNVFPEDATLAVSDLPPAVGEQCPPAACDGLWCGKAVVDVEEVCPGTPQTFELCRTCGEGPVTVEWDFDEDGVTDEKGNPVTGTVPAGEWYVTATATDLCSDPGPQSCVAAVLVNVLTGPHPVITPQGPTSFCASAGENVVLEANSGYTAYQWVRNGMPLLGEVQRTYRARSSGDYTVCVTDHQGCSNTSDPVTVHAGDCPLGEVSDPDAGEPPLRVLAGPPAGIVVDPEPGATAYNAYVDSIGSWYAPTVAGGSTCHARTWQDNPDGTITLDLPVPPGYWVVVTASNAQGEGPAGKDSKGRERISAGSWEWCGAAP
jgi:hypothetical protein